MDWAWWTSLLATMISRSIKPRLLLWGHLKSLVHAIPVDSDEDIVARISVTAIRVRAIPGAFESVLQYSTDAVKHVSMLVDAILDSYCKHCTCQGRCQ
ncbi:hypothetical protein AVEN_9291-1 [Araneus ventricosus]|uniref:Uncharacterized protein n=1 Tax=Araneus ventricosus TaxID=182803 RepID=A0A4Y2KYG0_ARAVE|nr:hypothetical protein AVEN_9291-1 [Araneus ventricosus]